MTEDTVRLEGDREATKIDRVNRQIERTYTGIILSHSSSILDLVFKLPASLVLCAVTPAGVCFKQRSKRHDSKFQRDEVPRDCSAVISIERL